MEEVDLIRLPESPHTQEGFQQLGPPNILVLVKLKADDLELAGRASELLENFNPLTIARVEKGKLLTERENSRTPTDFHSLYTSVNVCTDTRLLLETIDDTIHQRHFITLATLRALSNELIARESKE